MNRQSLDGSLPHALGKDHNTQLLGLTSYLEQLLPHGWTHLLVHHEDNNAPVVHSSPPRSPGHLDVFA